MSFLIYTTGIDNYGNPGIIEFWKNQMRADILRKLRLHPDDVRIVHFDPMMRNSAASKKARALAHNATLAPDTFRPEPLPMSVGAKPDLIIDFAHIFSYTSQGIPLLEGRPYPDLNVVYGGYVGDDIGDNLRNRQLTLSDKFLYMEDGQIKTYRDLIVRCFGSLTVDEGEEVRYPFNSVSVAVDEAKRRIITRWREVHGRAGDEYDEFIRTNLTLDVVMILLEVTQSRADFIDHVVTFINELI